MSLSDLVWRWQLTPREAFAGFTFLRVLPAHNRVTVMGLPWLQRNDPVPGHPGLTYRFGLAHAGAAIGDIAAIRAGQPDLPHTGDYRSGVLVMQGQAVVASYTIDGRNAKPRHRMAVAEGYRRRGLGSWMMREWGIRTMRPRVLAPQEHNGLGAKTFLAAQIAITEWAIAMGKNVPATVRAALVPDVVYLQALAAQVQETGESVVVTVP
ncbi:MAG: GNAT family N-acetyltransferase [Gammaproteobacteria bacterium]|nr:GNAT family N-acetyltransferase [Gammaproteobacteria bacterium]